MKRVEQNNQYVLVRLSILIILYAFVSPDVVLYAENYTVNGDSQAYILEKFKSHNLLMLGTRHKRQPILKLISNLIPNLYDAGVTHIGLEICSEQQDKIESFFKTGNGLADIKIHYQIDCPGYRDLLKQIRGLDEDKRPDIIAIDLPKSQYGQMSRDEYMAQSIAEVFGNMPDAKILIVSGNNHVLKKLDWQNHVPNKTRSVRSYLDELVTGLSAFSIGQLIDENPSECDFTRRFSQTEGSVALDCDENYHGWDIGMTSALAVKSTEAYELVDGVIVY